MSIQVSGKKQFVFYILLIIIFIFVLEGILRVYFYFEVNCAFMNSDVYPKLSYFQKKQICHDFYYIDSKHPRVSLAHFIPNQHTSTLNINNFGFRGPDISYEKPADTFRIFMIGGSTTYGAGASSDSTTIAGFLQQYFEQEDLPKKIQVINAGKSSFFSLSETQLVKSKLLEFEPDLFIVYDGFNDLDHTIEVHLGKKYQISFLDEVIEDASEIFPEYRTQKILRFYQAKIKTGVTTNETNSTFQVNATSELQKVQLWKERWSEICILGKDKGFDIIVTLQPILGSGNKELSKHEKLQYEKIAIHYISYYEKYAEALKELEKYCTGVKDLRFVFDPYSHTILYDVAHVVDEGNEIVAREMYKAILPIVKNRVSMNN